MTDGDGLTIGVLGSYGGRNLGDEAILTGLLGDLRRGRTPGSSSSPATRRTPRRPTRTSRRCPGRGSAGPTPRLTLAGWTCSSWAAAASSTTGRPAATCGWSGSPRNAACRCHVRGGGRAAERRRWTPEWSGRRWPRDRGDRPGRGVQDGAGGGGPGEPDHRHRRPGVAARTGGVPGELLREEGVRPAGGWSGSASGSRAGRRNTSTSTATTGCSPRSATSWCTGSTRTCCSCRWNATTSGTPTACCRRWSPPSRAGSCTATTRPARCWG